MVGEERLGPAELEAAGLYDPDAPDAAHRLALLEYLLGIGATLADFRLVGDSELPALASTIGLFPDRRRVSFDEAAARVGTTPELLRRAWRAAGFPDPRDGEDAMLLADVDLLAGLTAAIDLLGEDSVVSFMRLLGSVAARVADASISVFVTSAVPEALQRDPSGLELARLNYESVALIQLVVGGFDMLLRHHLHEARRFDDVVEHGVDVIPRSIGFVDLVGSTGLATALTPQALAAAFKEFDATAADAVTAGGGRLVKLIGDEVMFATVAPGAAVDIALRLVDVFAEHPTLPPVRAAVATGDVVARDGDYSGAVVNLAARAVKIAKPNMLVVDDVTRRSLRPDDFRCEPAGAFSLKGFADRQRLHTVTRPG